MKTLSYWARWMLLIGTIGMVSGLTLTSSRWGVSPVQAQTVPSPTPAPAQPKPAEGGVIILCVAGAPKEAWVVVQWQDLIGGWHEVENWSGRLDAESVTFVPGKVCAMRWVNRGNYGEKPFRWLIYSSRGGGVWAPSREFGFPESDGQWVWADLLGAPASAPAAPVATPQRLAKVGTCVGTHTVQAGENLFRIAYNCGLSTRQMATANGIGYPYTIYPGQVLRFP